MRGQAFAAMNTKFRWVFAAAIAYSSMFDGLGCLALLQRLEWKENRDRKFYIKDTASNGCNERNCHATDVSASTDNTASVADSDAKHYGNGSDSLDGDVL